VNCWFVTLSFGNPDKPFSSDDEDRLYKRFAIRRQDGEVLSMKIREHATA
jgi:hypothetical protein